MSTRELDPLRFMNAKVYTQAEMNAALTKAITDERERCAGITKDILPIGADDCYWCERVNGAVDRIRRDDTADTEGERR